MNNYKAKKFENLCEIDKFLEKGNLQKPNEKEAETLKRLITANKIKTVINKLLAHNGLGPMISQENITKHFRRSSPLSFTGYSKECKKRKTPKLFILIQHVPNPKTRKRHNKERKIQANITDEHRC